MGLSHFPTACCLCTGFFKPWTFRGLSYRSISKFLLYEVIKHFPFFFDAREAALKFRFPTFPFCCLSRPELKGIFHLMSHRRADPAHQVIQFLRR